jgi:hypothetical protein
MARTINITTIEILRARFMCAFSEELRMASMFVSLTYVRLMLRMTAGVVRDVSVDPFEVMNTGIAGDRYASAGRRFILRQERETGVERRNGEDHSQ